MPVDDLPSAPNRFLLLVGGDAARPDPSLADGAADVVVAVDSGLHLATALRLSVDHVVGDMDSVEPAALAEAEAAGSQIHVHPADKDATDLELALDLVLSLHQGTAGAPGEPDPDGAPAVVPLLHVAGGGGGRLDHLVGDLLMLSTPRLHGWQVTAQFGSAAVSVAWPGVTTAVSGSPGEQVSLLPIHGEASGVTTSGLRWPLVDGHLVAGTSRGISNELADQLATVSVDSGTVLVIRPGTRGDVLEERPGPYDPTPRPVNPRSKQNSRGERT